MAIGGQLEEVGRVAAAFTDFAAAVAMPTEVRRSLLVVLDDLLANVVSYGLAGRPAGEATVDVARTSEGVVITIADDGPPFDPLGKAAPDTTLPLDQRPIGGLGIHLVRRLVDEATYLREGDRNVTVLTKRWSASSHGDR